ncbi:hypothetical protein [Leifsonia poae]|uniref:hypothetical protein n=1 Tax=Leifsonia poae TaxID=110933 RepID=UPI001CBD8493|nr:hypothetical protein [Leifsonia poae]
MTTLNHHLPLTGAVPQVTRARGAFAVIAENAYLRLFTALVIVAAGAVALTLGIALLLDVVVPLFFSNEIHALAALFPQA